MATITDDERAEIRSEFIESGVACLEIKKQIADLFEELDAAEAHLLNVSEAWGEGFDDDEQIEMAQELWQRMGLDEAEIATLTQQMEEFFDQVAEAAADAEAANGVESDVVLEEDPLGGFTVIGNTE